MKDYYRKLPGFGRYFKSKFIFYRNKPIKLLYRLHRLLYQSLIIMIRLSIKIANKLKGKIKSKILKVKGKIFRIKNKIKGKILNNIKGKILKIKNKSLQVTIFFSHQIKSIKQHLRLQYQSIKNSIKNRLDENLIFSKDSSAIVDILKGGDPVKAANYLSNKYKLFAFASIRFLTALYRYAYVIETEDKSFWRSSNKEKILIHFCCWGESYSNKVKNYLLPSLLAANNLPALSDKCNVSLLIHCDIETKNLIIRSDCYKYLELYASVVFNVFPSRLMKLYHSRTGKISSIYPQIRYFLLGVCQTHAFKVALKYRAHLSYLMPDVVLSESFFTHAYSNIKNKKMVLTTTYRSRYETVRHHLDKCYADNRENNQLLISGDDLLKLQIEHIHPCEMKRIVSIKTDNFSPSARLIFKNRNGFIFRCFHYHPTIINCANINRPVGLDYLPIDNSALNDVLETNKPYHEQAWVCTNPAEMAIMELSDEAPEMEVVVNLTRLSYSQLVSQIQDLLKNAPTIFNTPFNQFLATFRHQFTVPDFMNSLAADDQIIDDVAFFDDVFSVEKIEERALTG